jgi:phosphoserine phosphatase RsbU/P
MRGKIGEAAPCTVTQGVESLLFVQTPISPADLRGMLRADAVGLALGVPLLIAGLLTLGFLVRARRRVAGLLWLGVFSILYGVRLLLRTATLRLYFDVPPAVWEHAAAAITYAVPIPVVLFARTMMPTWRRFWTAGAIGLTAFAVYAIASDAILKQPYSANTANSLIAVAFFIGVLGWLLRPGLPPSRELGTVRLGALCASLTVVADNLRNMGVLRFPYPDLEPFGATVLVACLGTVAVRRMLADARRLVVIDRELSIARQIQSSILPQAMPRVPGLTVVARYRPMTAVAGDFYDFMEIDARRLGVLVADVSGHGVPAALLASMVKMTLAAQRQHAERPAAVLAGINDMLCGRLAGQYVTAAYLFIDTDARSIRYAAAGHPPMLRSARRDREVHAVEQNGLMLGFVEGTGYKEVEQPLRTDDRLLLYTDGLIEAANAGDDLFGLERLKATLADASELDPQVAADTLLTTIDTWSGQPPGDDFTIVLVDWANER